MEIFFAIAIVGIILMSCITFFIGKKLGDNGDNKEKVLSLESRIAEMLTKVESQDRIIIEQTDKIIELTSKCSEYKTNAENTLKQLDIQREQNDVIKKEETERNEKAILELKKSYEHQISELKDSYNKQLVQVKENTEKQLVQLRDMNKEQVEAQLALIKEQMRTTSEDVLKIRQAELENRNKEQVSKIIDPLQKSLKDMEQALNYSKEQQKEALTRLDETIKLNMEKSVSLGETADRLTRALTGEVKIQGNFGELKLKQLLEDLELKEGEQFDTQETLRDKSGKSIKGDDGKGLVPDFILHFPNNRHVVVDSKMSLTDYERYMNTEDGVPEKSIYLRAHIDSVRAQVKRLAKKEYTKYLPTGYNRLNFAIMYVPIEGALNLALLNDTTLWRDAYDDGVMILGPQTMYMNLRVLEMMWTQVRQLNNQEAMMNAANVIIERVQDFGMRFMDVESSMNDTIEKMSKLKITTSDRGASIITAARNLLKAGAKENKKKKSLVEMDDSLFLDTDTALMLPDVDVKEE
jgi:DNA anti-recombination protein RmuC